ncbi:signal recognition particle-docking protein FtsY [Crinalium epipsammum PCC 9333]|uniref:Signal recognition particle receptor FtsY n=1 Tax=Crinalium epipsammum PCC 9333 TaxID=1173022 RepID=K9VY13_9CYAN|nr:signal recognition particle-docking protein FtsY [Crinalium epipsammum]AFZ12861.1 signal recognition particle-docking protein FtsY [Crinalium epipsammum PCC 9333]
MVFNWFRRQFGDSQNTEVEQVETVAESPAEQEASVTSEEESQEVAADYLNWAKAAYKNIQQQQRSPDEEISTPEVEASTPNQAEITIDESAKALLTEGIATTTTETNANATVAAIATSEVETNAANLLEESLPEPTETSVIEETADTEAELTSQSLELESTELTETSPELEPIASTIVEPTTNAIVEAATEAITPEVITPAKKEDSPELPIWARESSAERQARLERLKATAIEEPEPVIATKTQTSLETATAEAEIDFDEGFLWSAEVLASQGRRPEDVSLEEISWLKRLRQGLDKTRRGLINQLKAIVGQGPLNQDAVMEIEALLLQADVGVEATDYIINTLQQKLREEVLPPEQAIAYLKQILRELLEQPYQNSYNPIFVPEKDTLNIWLITGVNGAGKTTTIGKIAHLAQKSGYKCLIAAADTFRAAAVEQVKVWGERSGIDVIANPGKNADPAAVVFDGISAAQARGTELLLIDTAGRLQNKKNLMDELSKIRRIVDKKSPNAKVESLLVLDATLGQNGLRQAEVFSQAAKLSGVVLTKLDGTAKGGVALAVVKELGLPIRFIGAGEGIEDLRPFSSYEFIEALLSG